MIDWLAHAPALGAAVGVVFVPGLVVGLAARLRGLFLVAFAPVLSTAVFGLGSIVLAAAGIGWGPLSALTAVVVAAALAAVGVRLLRAPTAPRRGDFAGTRLLIVSIAAGAVLSTARLALYITDPTALSQTNDASFHLSALRFAVETGWASPFQITTVIGASSFYPSGWHLFAALVPAMTGDSVEVAANTVSLAIGGLVWPLGIALLTRAAAGPVAAAVATAANSLLPAFPLLMVQWGVLYPQLLAVALLPAALASVLSVHGLAGGSERRGAQVGGMVRPVLLMGASAAALLLAQPSVFLAWLLLAVMIAAGSLTMVSRRRRVVAAGALAAATIGLVALWLFFGRSIEGVWPPSTGKLTAALEVIVNGYLGYPWVVGVSTLTVVGLVQAFRNRRWWWLAGGWVAFALLYIVSASIGLDWLRRALTGPWYEDPYRLAALMPVVVLPLAGIGGAAVIAWASKAVGARASRGAIVAVMVVTAIGVVSLVVAPQVARRDVFAHVVDPNLYTTTATSYLSTDELILLRRLNESVPADAVVVGNPSTGMAFGYALSGRNVIPRTWAPPTGEAYDVLWTSLRDVAENPAVCPALDAFGARYVLDFGPGEEYPGRWLMPGFDGLGDRPGFALVDREGAATLWRVTACD